MTDISSCHWWMTAREQEVCFGSRPRTQSSYCKVVLPPKKRRRLIENSTEISWLSLAKFCRKKNIVKIILNKIDEQNFARKITINVFYFVNLYIKMGNIGFYKYSIIFFITFIIISLKKFKSNLFFPIYLPLCSLVTLLPFVKSFEKLIKIIDFLQHFHYKREKFKPGLYIVPYYPYAVGGGGGLNFFLWFLGRE